MSRAIEMTGGRESPRVAFQGERGAFSEEAAVKLLGEEIQLVPRPTFEALYASIGDRLADSILAPHPSIKRVAADDTAGSVRDVMQAGDPARAAIASGRAAAVYGATILKEHLEDHPENYTRFLLLTPSAEVPEKADKLSLVLHLAHKPGSLCLALNAFARRDLNLLKIESRPIAGTPWSYCFYLDLQASLKDPNTIAALEELRQFTDSVKILGCYPQAKV